MSYTDRGMWQHLHRTSPHMDRPQGDVGGGGGRITCVRINNSTIAVGSAGFHLQVPKVIREKAGEVTQASPYMIILLDFAITDLLLLPRYIY